MKKTKENKAITKKETTNVSGGSAVNGGLGTTGGAGGSGTVSIGSIATGTYVEY